MKLNLKNIKHDLLSPGNIFWQKKSGDSVLISKKGEALNHELIRKLEDAEYSLIITDVIDTYAYQKIHNLYLEYCNEVFMKDKIKCREDLISLLVTEFVENEKTQFEVNQLAWTIFSEFTTAEGMNFIRKDNDLFQRHLSVASSYAFCAFLLGYYDPTFLSNLFSSTLKNFMDLGESVHVLSLKEKFEYLRLQESFQREDYEAVKEIANEGLISKTVIFERYDGSGPRQINSREMSDLEIVMVALNTKYSFELDKNENIFKTIENGDFKCEVRTLKMLQRTLKKKPVENLAAA